MNVAQLIERLKEQPQDAIVVMCMDWTKIHKGNESGEQWEDLLGDVASVNSKKASWVYLLNENFK